MQVAIDLIAGVYEQVKQDFINKQASDTFNVTQWVSEWTADTSEADLPGHTCAPCPCVPMHPSCMPHVN